MVLAGPRPLALLEAHSVRRCFQTPMRRGVSVWIAIVNVVYTVPVDVFSVQRVTIALAQKPFFLEESWASCVLFCY